MTKEIKLTLTDKATLCTAMKYMVDRLYEVRPEIRELPEYKEMLMSVIHIIHEFDLNDGIEILNQLLEN